MTVTDPLLLGLEAELADHPDDLATHMAHADRLQEMSDPSMIARGEFIRVQLRLEDEKISPAERKKLQGREDRLRRQHERDWLGPLAPYLLDGEQSQQDRPVRAHRWHRGWLGRLEIHNLTRRLAQALVDAPAGRLLRELSVRDDDPHDDETTPPPPRVRTPGNTTHHLALFEMIGAPCLANLRHFRMGVDWEAGDRDPNCFCYVPGLEHVVRNMPRIEELYLHAKLYSTRSLFGLKNLTNLRVLVVDHQDSYPMKTLAKNPALANLTRLGFHPHYWKHYYNDEIGHSRGYLPLTSLETLLNSPHIRKLTHLRFRLSSAGDEGVRRLIDSGLLRQLKVLDLRHGRVTGAGARLLADCPEARNLDLLDLTNNQLTPAGVALLASAGVKASCDDQAREGDDSYLEEGDFE
jgi:uncharacterized protein (TIGR02996 family)